jgi:hypothetical protein
LHLFRSCPDRVPTSDHRHALDELAKDDEPWELRTLIVCRPSSPHRGR